MLQLCTYRFSCTTVSSTRVISVVKVFASNDDSRYRSALNCKGSLSS